jgi:uncharacterized membrane protein
MLTLASIGKHPTRQKPVVLLAGLVIFLLVCGLVDPGAQGSVWPTVALYAMVGGLVGALAAVVPGVIGLASLADRQVKKIAPAPVTINLIVVGLYAVNIWVCSGDPASMGVAIALPLIGVGMLAVTGWLGGEMVR